ncbi:MAG TPA: flagellar motor protein MotB [Bryobacteraceae bacterium]|nr:flagellar motor protein MotB [Bryobacteraceae bacterium]
MGTPDLQPIIIKKKKAHSDHHGGAWKVAYADFVTAMMALFIVLWLMGSDAPVKKAVAGYFTDPSGKKGITGSGQAGSGENLSLKKDDFAKLKETIEAAMKQSPQLEKLKNQVNMTVTGEGLRIELLESEVGTFFDTGSPSPSSSGKDMLQVISKELGKMPNKLFIEGHTDAKPFSSKNGYSNWELSSDRANSARKVMQDSGVRADQVVEVRGYADQRLRKPDDPANASNRRVSIVVKYLTPPPRAEKPPEKSEHK